MLVELSVMEQRYQAVLAVVQEGWKVTEVADRLGVSRQTVHAWIARYERGGLSSLADRSHRPESCPTRSVPRSRPWSASYAGSTLDGDRDGSAINWTSSASTRFRAARVSTGASSVTA